MHIQYKRYLYRVLEYEYIKQILYTISVSINGTGKTPSSPC